jgi:hypothetical protein
MQDESPLVFPKKADKERLNNYDYFDKLYFGDHYTAFAIKGEKEFTQRYNKLRYVVANFAGLMSRVMADMLFGERIVFDCTDKSNQVWMDGFMEDNGFIAQMYESALANSRRGDSIFKLRVGQLENSPSSKSTVIIEEVTPAIYFPVLDVNNGRYRPKEDVLAWVFEQQGKAYLHKETHRPGYIFHEIFEYDKNAGKIKSQLSVEEFGFKPVEETKVERSLIFHIPNVRDGSGFWGTSDYKDLEPLFFALNNRITKTDNILDKHSDPILAVPQGVLDENGKVNKSALNMFEVDNENPGFNKPEYIVWNANLDAAFKEIDKLVDLLFMFSEISPATMGMSKDGGQAESGRALKFKLLRTIAKRNRKKIYYDAALKKMLETAMELGKAWGIEIDGAKVAKPEAPSIDWGDGVLNDETEQTDISVKRIDAGTISKADAIARLDGISPDDAKKKVKEIEAEGAVNLPPAPGEKSGAVNPPAPGAPAVPPAAGTPTKAQPTVPAGA